MDIGLGKRPGVTSKRGGELLSQFFALATLTIGRISGKKPNAGVADKT